VALLLVLRKITQSLMKCASLDFGIKETSSSATDGFVCALPSTYFKRTLVMDRGALRSVLVEEKRKAKLSTIACPCACYRKTSHSRCYMRAFFHFLDS
jgi:hypothetical protein